MDQPLGNASYLALGMSRVHRNPTSMIIGSSTFARPSRRDFNYGHVIKKNKWKVTFSLDDLDIIVKHLSPNMRIKSYQGVIVLLPNHHLLGMDRVVMEN